jgi:hypothetical protein
MNTKMAIKDEHKDMFLKLKKIILSFDGIKLRKNQNQNAFYDKYRVIVMIRSTSNEDVLTTSWGQGAKLENSFKVFSGDGKYVRHIKYNNINQINDKLIKELIIESMTLNMEAYELKKLKCNLKA